MRLKSSTGTTVAALIITAATSISVVAAAGTCVDLTNTVCGAFAPSLIQTDGPNAAFLNSTTRRSDVAKAVLGLGGLFPPELGCSNLTTTAAGNLTRTVPNVRYALSLECQDLVLKSTDCTAPTSTRPATTPTSSPATPGSNGRPVRLCRTTCNTFRDAVIAQFNSISAQCNGQDIIAQTARSEWMRRTNEVCLALNDEPGCLVAVAAELNNCGWGNTQAGLDLARARTCSAANAADPCCKQELKLVTVADGTTLKGSGSADDDLDMLPLFAGISGGLFFGVIAIGTSILRWVENQGGAGTVSGDGHPKSEGDLGWRENNHAHNQAAGGLEGGLGAAGGAAGSTIHAARAQKGARASGLWNGGGAPQQQPQSSSPVHYTNLIAPTPAFLSTAQNGSSSPTPYNSHQPYSTTPPTPTTAINNPFNSSFTTVASSSAHMSTHDPLSSYYTSSSPPNDETLQTKKKRTQSVASRYSLRHDSYHPDHSNDSSTNPMPEFYHAVVNESYSEADSDEVGLHVGDLVRVFQVFDDGWGYGVNTSTGQTGVFPVVCLTNV
ncbi:hypothetical protein DFS34DRAFT_632760 [Phlyctochytrium arcticum]|nr:hypothetical protein DFS34DRAFT_632760 [Phlyctochytrium arcticum]